MRYPFLILALAALVGCARAQPTEQAAEACQRAGHSQGTQGFASCFERVLPAYVQADGSRQAAAMAILSNSGAAFRAPAFQQPVRLQTSCHTFGGITNCY